MRHNDKKIEVAIRSGLATRVRTKKVNALGSQTLTQTLCNHTRFLWQCGTIRFHISRDIPSVFSPGKNVAAGVEHFGRADSLQTFLPELDTLNQGARFTFDVRPENAVAFACGKPETGSLARRKYRDAGDADGGGHMHRAGVVAEKKRAAFQRGGRSAKIERAGSVVAAPPFI